MRQLYEIAHRRGVPLRDVLDMAESEFAGWVEFYRGRSDG